MQNETKIDHPYYNDSIKMWQFCLGWILFAALLFGLGWVLWGPYQDNTPFFQECLQRGYTDEQCAQFVLDGEKYPTNTP